MQEKRQPWQRTLWIIWLAMFIMNAGFSLIMPFLPLYVKTMGITDPRSVEIWSGIIFSANFITAAISLPFWGRLADRFGRRMMMIRASVGLGIVVGLMGFAHHPWQLLVLRLLQGCTVGFMPAAIAYMTSITPKERTGYMLSLLQTSQTVGTIFGPLLGGILAHLMGYGKVFFATGISCFLAGLVAFLFVKEEISPAAKAESQQHKQEGSLATDLRVVATNATLLAALLVVLVQQASVQTSEPIITLFLGTLHVPDHLLELLGGLVFSIVGVTDVMASPFLGRRGDTLGYRKVLIISLAGVGVAYTLQGVAQTWAQLLILRALQGCFVGGVLASANALIALSTARSFQGRAFGLASSGMMVGNFIGPLMGSALAATLSLRAVFPITGLLCFANLLWVLRAVPPDSTRETSPAPVARQH